MAELLKGKPVAEHLDALSRSEAQKLIERGIQPTLAIVRVGEKDDDITYENSAARKCALCGIQVRKITFDNDVSKEEFYGKLKKMNDDDTIHGILLLRPLPAQLDNNLAANSISLLKDIDGGSDQALNCLEQKRKEGHIPCTAEAIMELLNFYDFDVKNKNVTVIGRSNVVGKPVRLLLEHAGADVTVCHSKTTNTAQCCQQADILICATGKMEMVNHSYVKADQVVVDAGIQWNEVKNKLCGDCLFEEVEPIVRAITPVPGGIGSITCSILVKHVLHSAASGCHSGS